MKTNIDQQLDTAQSVPVQYLHEQYLLKNPPKSKSDINNIKKAFEILLKLFPEINTGSFTANHLIAYKNSLPEIDGKNGKYSLNYCNKLIGFVKQVFNWGVNPNSKSTNINDFDVHYVSPMLVFLFEKIPQLEEGEARQSPKRKAVPQEYIDEIMKYLPQNVTDMLQLQLMKGLRPSEVCKMRVCDIKRTKNEFADHGRLFDGVNWIYVIEDHKTKKYLGEKIIPLGLEEQEILEKYLDGKNLNEPVFSKKTKRGYGKPFTVDEYGRFFCRTIKKYNLPKFTPYQLRHTALTEISVEHGKDTARAVAGHTSEKMLAVYDHGDYDKFLAITTENNRQYCKKKALGYSEKPIEHHSLRIFNGE